jgi:glycosyltransferase involved in cell wall biosynthesis
VDTTSLRIGVVAPPWFEVPPIGYGGIEVLCADLVDALVARGHDVLLIGAGSHGTNGRFVATGATGDSERLGQGLPEVVHAAAAARIIDEAELDVVHDHTCAGPLLAFGRPQATVVTAHGPAAGELGEYYRRLGDRVALVAISAAQRASAPDLPWQATVPNAVDVTRHKFTAVKDDFVLFLGRVSGEKAPDLAIQAARAAGRPLVAAVKCGEPEEWRYFEEHVEPLLGSDVTWLIDPPQDQKIDLLARARCLIFPIQWEEPFGLVMIEAMASGTPVVALRRGSVPEVIVDGQTGYICDDPSQLPAAIEATSDLDPVACRQHVSSRFSPSRMARGYERLYRRAIARAKELNAAATPVDTDAPRANSANSVTAISAAAEHRPA